MTLIWATVMFEVLEAEIVDGGELDTIIGVLDGKQRWLREEELAFIGMAVKTRIPRL